MQHHVEAEGGKQLYDTGVGGWFKEWKEPHGSDWILNRTTFTLTQLRLQNSVLDRKLRRVMLIDFSFLCLFYMLNKPVNCLITKSQQMLKVTSCPFSNFSNV